MEIPFQPSGWDVEARQLIAEGGYTVEHAVETVTLRYLTAGDYRPLLDSKQRGHTCGGKVKECLAAMLDPQYRSRNSVSPQYEFGFKLARGRGRPKKLQIIDRFFLCIWRGMRDVASGWEPRLLFWQYLFAALDPDYRDMVEEALHEPFPWRARIQPVERDKGRRSDPELPMRDKVLAWLVQRGLDRGEKYN